MLLLMLAGAFLTLLRPSSSFADKIIYKDGDVIEGIIQEEFPSRVTFLYQGKPLVIYKSRIEEIIRESGAGNIDMLLNRAGEAIIAGDTGTARAHLENAKSLPDPDGSYAPRIADLEENLRLAMTSGSAEDRRATAVDLLDQARVSFDRIQNQRGVELVFEALEIDPGFAEAHDVMADFMTKNFLSLDRSLEYFCERADPALLKPDHPIIERLPSMYEKVIAMLQEARTPDVIALHSRHLKIISAAFDQSPEWAEKGTVYQKTMIEKRSAGVITEQVDQALDRGDYQSAYERLAAWEPATAGPEVARYYVRTWLGSRELERAEVVLKNAYEKAPDTAWAEQTINSLAGYRAALSARDEGDHAAARESLDALFNRRAELLPELAVLIARAKVVYDLEDMEATESAGKPTSAADQALRILAYTADDASAEAALRGFDRLSPQVSFQLNLLWFVDGFNIPLHGESTDLVRGALAGRFNLRFDDASPFLLTIRIDHSTAGQSGSRVLQAAGEEEPYNLDYIDPDARIIGMGIVLQVAHPEAPSLFSHSIANPAAPPGAAMARLDQFDKLIYLDLKLLSDIDTFLKGDFPLYLPPETSTLGGRMRASAN